MELTLRDVEIITLLQKGLIADTFLLNDLFFSSQKACNRRLVKLTRHNFIKRTRDDSRKPYLYYHSQMPKSQVHSLLKTKILSHFKKSALKILTYENNFQAGALTADLLIIIETPKKQTIALWFDVKTRGEFNPKKIETALQHQDQLRCMVDKINKLVPCHGLKILACSPKNAESNKFQHQHFRPEHLEDDLAPIIQSYEKL